MHRKDEKRASLFQVEAKERDVVAEPPQRGDGRHDGEREADDDERKANRLKSDEPRGRTSPVP